MSKLIIKQFYTIDSQYPLEVITDIASTPETGHTTATAKTLETTNPNTPDYCDTKA